MFNVQFSASENPSFTSEGIPFVLVNGVLVVDDVCTTGMSLFQAIDAAEARGCSVVKVLALLDRREGGSDELRRRGYDFQALLEADEAGNVSPSL